MRQLNTQEVQAVAGAGLITGTLGTAVKAGAAVGKGLVQAGVIVAKPVVAGTVNLFKFLI